MDSHLLLPTCAQPSLVRRMDRLAASDVVGAMDCVRELRNDSELAELAPGAELTMVQEARGLSLRALRLRDLNRGQPCRRRVAGRMALDGGRATRSRAAPPATTTLGRTALRSLPRNTVALHTDCAGARASPTPPRGLRLGDTARNPPARHTGALRQRPPVQRPGALPHGVEPPEVRATVRKVARALLHTYYRAWVCSPGAAGMASLMHGFSEHLGLPQRARRAARRASADRGPPQARLSRLCALTDARGRCAPPRCY